MKCNPEIDQLRKRQDSAFGSLVKFLIFFLSFFSFASFFSQVSTDSLYHKNEKQALITIKGDVCIISNDSDFNEKIRDKKIVLVNSSISEGKDGTLVYSANNPEIPESVDTNSIEKHHEKHLVESKKPDQEIIENDKKFEFHFETEEDGQLRIFRTVSTSTGIIFVSNLIFLHTAQLSVLERQNHYYSRKYYCGPLLSALECLNMRLFARPPPSYV